MIVNLEERVDRLETLYGDFVAKVGAALLRMERDTEALKKEMRLERKQINRQLGELSNKLGTLVEDLAHPSLKRVIREEFNLKIEQIMIRVERELEDGRFREFDAIALGGDLVFLNSTKTTLRNQYVDQFIEEIKEFRDFFPEYAGRKIVGILAALNINEEQLKYAEKKGFLVLGVGEEVMEVKNRQDFKPKLF